MCQNPSARCDALRVKRKRVTPVNIAQAKRIPLSLILEKEGFQPVKQRGADWWYLSPFRKETEASFHICTRRNIWNDLGTGQGGTVIDFAMQYYQVPISEALKKLERMDLSDHSAPASPAASLPLFDATAQAEENPVLVKKVQPLMNRALIGYLYGRGIPYKLAKNYLQEIYYTRKDEAGNEKSYFALAFPNDSGGYELRNPYFQGSFPPKDITYLPSHQASDDRAITIFEGFSDFLSALVYYGREEATTPVIVLNSVAMQQRAVDTIKRKGATKVYVYPDHDKGGQDLLKFLRDQLPGVEILDKSEVYKGYKDFNQFLTEGRNVTRSR